MTNVKLRDWEILAILEILSQEPAARFYSDTYLKTRRQLKDRFTKIAEKTWTEHMRRNRYQRAFKIIRSPVEGIP